jgi:hypothetical protein
MDVAPPSVLAAARDTVAMPEELVSAVPFAGDKVASVGSVTVKVTTTLAAGAPDESITVALTLAGALVVAAPVVELTNAKVIVGVPVGVLVVDPPVVGVLTALPPHPTKIAVNVIASR